MTVDLCVVNYNTKYQLQRLLDTLAKDDDGCSWELFIADNDSTDGSKEFLKSLSNNYRVKVISHNLNIGYAKAINKLAAMGHSPYVAALNADVWLCTEDVKAIEKTFENDPKAAVVGPKQRDEKGHIRHAGIMWQNGGFYHRSWAIPDPLDRIHVGEVIECGTVSGSAYFVRRSIWDEMTSCPIFQKEFPGAPGAFGETPLYFEETLLSRHVKAHGYKVLYDGTVSIGHTWAASTPEGNNSNAHYIPISKEMYVKFCRAHDIPVEKNLMQ